MVVETLLEDNELGRFLIKENPRARRLTFRAREDAIYVTVPPGTSPQEIRRAIEDLRPRLRASRTKQVRPLIDLDFRIDADLFKLRIVSGQRERFLTHSVSGEMHIVCPPGTDFSNAALQTWFHKAIEAGLKHHAKLILPPRLHELSRKHNLPYRNVKINSSKGRWGSCSAQQTINLSCYLILLPEHLVDYVLLHELSHTREMNHGERFWALLDELTEGKARALREEVRLYRTGI